jgi:hypothetical protein
MWGAQQMAVREVQHCLHQIQLQAANVRLRKGGYLTSEMHDDRTQHLQIAATPQIIQTCIL